MEYTHKFWIWFISAPMEEVLAWASVVGFLLAAASVVLIPDTYHNRRNHG